jgi:hypothetical protein
MNALNVTGEPGNCEMWPLGANRVTANTRSPKANVSREPSSDSTEVTVTPVERVILGCLLFRCVCLVTCDR